MTSPSTEPKHPPWRRAAPANRLIAVLLGLILSPVIAATAVIVRLTIGRPILFAQARVGLHGHLFTLTKFRTMRAATFPNEPDAERLTRAGNFLRKSSLDELPTLWNVLRGDMAVVGPRPLLPAYTALYNAQQRVRLDVHPGLTGWAQINGRNRLTWDDKFDMDRWYVEHQSLWLDGLILFCTPMAILKIGQTVHAKHASMPAFVGSADSLIASPPGDETLNPPHLYLSAPDVGSLERSALLDAFDSNWLAPSGPDVDRFEREFAEALGVDHAVALSSGTAALHLALCALGIGPGDTVLLPSLTFVATANAVHYTGAKPAFIDSESKTWNIDPSLVAEELADRARSGHLPGALIAVDLYGQCADYTSLRDICETYQVPIIEDAAEALGANLLGQPAGTFGAIGAFSFNGNKIITTSGGGMLVTDTSAWAEQARHLASQAREPTRHYEHIVVGYNYRMSNLLASVGRAQLQQLSAKVDRRRHIFERYHSGLADLPGLTFMPESVDSRSTRWLTVGLIEPVLSGIDRDCVIAALAAQNIEARPAWKPMHLQRLYMHSPMRGGSISERIFAQGICLPSGSGLTDGDVDRIVATVRKAWNPSQ